MVNETELGLGEESSKFGIARDEETTDGGKSVGKELMMKYSP